MNARPEATELKKYVYQLEATNGDVLDRKDTAMALWPEFLLRRHQGVTIRAIEVP